MLTAAGDVQARVAGLELGADDYLAKPFAFARRPSRTLPTALTWGDVRLDTNRREVFRDERDIRLTRKELGVLEQLKRAADGVVSAEQLLDAVWDENADPFTNAIRITLMALRRKLGDPPCIETVTGAGYRLA
jgi:two-component system, OmpR family, response regulator VanR